MTNRVQIPDYPQDLPLNLRDWCEAIQNIVLTVFDANGTLSASRCPTLEEMIDAGIPNAETLDGTFIPLAVSFGIPDLPQDAPFNLRDWCEAIQGVFIEKTDANKTGDPSRVVLVGEMIGGDVTNASNLIADFVPIVKLLGIPDIPQDLPYNLREWCEAIQSTLLIVTDAKSEVGATRCATVQELIDAGVPNAENLLPLEDRPTTSEELASLVAWWDFSDITTLFKDIARTDPVTTNGDVIKGVTDKSGNGNHLGASTGTGVVYETGVKNGQSAANNSTANTQYLEIAELDLSSPHAIVAVAKIPTTLDATGFENTLLGGASASTGTNLIQLSSHPSQGGAWAYSINSVVTKSVLIPSHQPDEWHIWVLHADGGLNPTYVENNFDVTLLGGGVISEAGFRYGHDSNLGEGEWESYGGEIRIYEGDFADADRIALVNSLKTKWDIT